MPGEEAHPDRWVVGVAAHPAIRRRYLAPADIDRLRKVADVVFEDFESSAPFGEAVFDQKMSDRLADFTTRLDALVVCHGAPRVTAELLDGAPRLRFVGELEGDRRGGRVDVEAAVSRGVTVVDTTHGSSLPVAEWALALMILGLRDAGRLFRRLIAGEAVFADPGDREASRSYGDCELSGRRVGMIGFGHIAWRLTELLRPFDSEILAYDLYAPREMAELAGVTFTRLESVLACDVVCCLVPLTPRTEGMIGRSELAYLRPGAVFVNVSRGKVVDSGALVERLRAGDVVACLDVLDPEPIPQESALRLLPNVFLSPHIGGVTGESRRRFFALMVDDLLRAIAGHEPRSLLDPVTPRRRIEGC